MIPRIALASLFLLIGPTDAPDDGEQYRNAVGSVVWITTYDHDWEPSNGTGIVVEGGDILTAYHVVEDGPCVITFPELDGDGDVIADSAHYMADKGRFLPCRVVHRDEGRDLALLRLSTARPDTRPIAMATRSPTAGQSIFTIGNTCHPGVLFRFAAGHVRQVAPHTLKYPKEPVAARNLVMSIPLNGGDSGGPVIRNGELVGMNTSADQDLNQIGYAVDITEIRAFLEAAREKK